MPDRLYPPTRAEDIKSPLGRRAIARAMPGAFSADAAVWYVTEYNRGWRAARSDNAREWQNGTSTDAYDDGYLDRAAGRPKWHLTYCSDHDTCGE